MKQRNNTLMLLIATYLLGFVFGFAAASTQPAHAEMRHNGAVSATCEGGLTINATNYNAHATNVVTYAVDGVSHHTEFGASFHLVIPNPNKTVPHNWSVKIDQGDGSQFDFTYQGVIPSCESTTTTVPTTSTTTVTLPTSTTTIPATSTTLPYNGGTTTLPQPSTTTSTPITPTPPGATPTSTVKGDCQEDEPCWNCATMGNHVCGPLSVIVPNCGDVVGVTCVTPPAQVVGPSIPATGKETVRLLGVALLLSVVGLVLLWLNRSTKPPVT